MNLKILSLSNGLHILCEILKIEADQGFLTFKNPVLVQYVAYDPLNTAVLSFIPYMAFCKDRTTGIDIPMHAIIHITEPTDKLVITYIAIITPDKVFVPGSERIQ